MSNSTNYWSVVGTSLGQDEVADAPILKQYHPRQGEKAELKEEVNAGVGTGRMILVPDAWNDQEARKMLAKLRFDIVELVPNSGNHILRASGIMSDPDHILKGYQLLAMNIRVLRESGGSPKAFSSRLFWCEANNLHALAATDWRWDP